MVNFNFLNMYLKRMYPRFFNVWHIAISDMYCIQYQYRVRAALKFEMYVTNIAVKSKTVQQLCHSRYLFAQTNIQESGVPVSMTETVKVLL